MKSLAPDVFRLVEAAHGYADLAWTASIPIPGDPEFPVLQLPETHLAYATTRGYPVKLEPRKVAGHPRPLLFVQIESFELATHADAGWAIPARYTPRTDEERIAHALGFDGGWEDAQPECSFICDERFAVFWRAVLARERFGLGAVGGSSLYAAVLGDDELAALRKLLAKWPKPA